jgi:hypothetical protein
MHTNKVFWFTMVITERLRNLSKGVLKGVRYMRSYLDTTEGSRATMESMEGARAMTGEFRLILGYRDRFWSIKEWSTVMLGAQWASWTSRRGPGPCQGPR